MVLFSPLPAYSYLALGCKILRCSTQLSMKFWSLLKLVPGIRLAQNFRVTSCLCRGDLERYFNNQSDTRLHFALIDPFHIVCAHAYIGHVARYFSIIGETLQRWGKRILSH